MDVVVTGSPAEAVAAASPNEAARVAWVERTLRSLPAGSRILDAGAGEQQFRRFCAHLQYVSQDIAEYDGSGNGHGLQTGRWDFGRLDHVCDIASIPEPDASFDAVLCTEVFEHLPDPLPALREFSRLLRPGGQLIVTAPFCSLTHFAPYHYATGFNRYYYEQHLPKHGFRIVELTPNGNYFLYLAQELRRLPDVSARFTGERMRRWHFHGLNWLLRFLEACGRCDAGSSDLLCFGYHVRAVKTDATER